MVIHVPSMDHPSIDPPVKYLRNSEMGVGKMGVLYSVSFRKSFEGGQNRSAAR